MNSQTETLSGQQILPQSSAAAPPAPLPHRHHYPQILPQPSPPPAAVAAAVSPPPQSHPTTQHSDHTQQQHHNNDDNSRYDPPRLHTGPSSSYRPHSIFSMPPRTNFDDRSTIRTVPPIQIQKFEQMVYEQKLHEQRLGQFQETLVARDLALRRKSEQLHRREIQLQPPSPDVQLIMHKLDKLEKLFERVTLNLEQSSSSSSTGFPRPSSAYSAPQSHDQFRTFDNFNPPAVGPNY